MKKFFLKSLVLCSVLFLSACSIFTSSQEEETQTKGNLEQKSQEEAENTKDQTDPMRPLTKEDTIVIEGTENPFQFSLYQNKDLGMSTYIVEDMRVESLDLDEGHGMLVYENIGGGGNNAFIQFFSPTGQKIQTIKHLEEWTKGKVKEQGFEIIPNDAHKKFEWSEVEVSIQKKLEDGRNVIGTVSLFERNGKLYQFTVQYPEEYEEGFAPRILKFVKDTQWVN
jgi:hypothetical protein